ncbi:MAG: Ig-like domain-containing protein [Acetivibrio ethanolgignens]
MKNKLKKWVAAVAALAVAFTAVVVTDVTAAWAATAYDTLYTSGETAETGNAGVENKIPFTVSKNGDSCFYVSVAKPTGYTVTLYNSEGVPVEGANNPFYISSTNENWKTDESGATNVDVWSGLPNGDYYYGIKFDTSNSYFLDILLFLPDAKISQTKATITTGYTQKLSVEGAKVTKWSSNKTSVATVDSKGKVTAKKAGKATISAKLDNGQTVKCAVTVKANKYTSSKPSVSDVTRGNCVLTAYSASFDSKGNLVIKARFVNNDYYKVTALKDVKITVKDASGKAVGTYSVKKKSAMVPSASTKDFTFTIKKANLKQKKADLRNATITSDGVYIYVY